MKRGNGTLVKHRKSQTKDGCAKDISDNFFHEFTTLSEICLQSGFPHDCYSHVDSVLSQTARQTDLGRILVLLKERTELWSVSNEWCGEGIEPGAGMLRDLSIKSLPSLITLPEAFDPVVADDTSRLPDDLALLFEAHKAGAAVITLLDGSELFRGLVIFENCRGKRHWTDSQIRLLTTVTGIISKCYHCNYHNSSLVAEKVKAEKSNTDRRDFITRISHEIRTPLNAMIGLSEALYYKVDSEANKKLVKSMISSGKLLSALLNDVLELSRIDAGRLMILKEKSDTVSILDDIEAIFHDIAARKNLDLFVERSISLPRFLMMDERRTKQILFNLVTNAISFTRWGHVTVSADFISIEGNSGRLVLRVADTGPGIPSDKLSMIFDEYIQYEPAKFYEEGSTGLGLAISRKLAVTMGGSIKAESEEGKGSVFTVILPSEEPDDIQKAAKPVALDFADIEFIDSSVLVIDDISSGIEIIENHAADSGLKIFSASDLDSALEKLAGNRVDLILMDRYMPLITGHDMVRMIRTKPELQKIPVVAYTGATAARGHLREFDGYDDFLLKPVSRENLFNLLIKYLRYEIRIRR